MCPNGADEVPKVDSPSAQNEQSKCSKWTGDVPNMNTAIPEITSEITTKNTSETSSSKYAGEKEEDKDAFQFFEQNGFGKIGNYHRGRINSWCTELSSELVVEAMKLALENGSNRWNYVEAILKDWCSKGRGTKRLTK